MNSFSQSLRKSCERLDGAEISMHSVEFQDTILIHISRDGELDVTYGITTTEGFRLEGRSFPSPTVLMGGSFNVKCSIMASQVGTLVKSFCNKNIIVSTSSKLWNEKNDEKDFEKLCIILEMVKKSYQ